MNIEIRDLFPFLKSCSLYENGREIASVIRKGIFRSRAEISWGKDKYLITEEGLWKTKYIVVDSYSKRQLGATDPKVVIYRSLSTKLTLDNEEFLLKTNFIDNCYTLEWINSNKESLITYDFNDFLTNKKWFFRSTKLLKTKAVMNIKVNIDKNVQIMSLLGIYLFMLFVTSNNVD